MTTHTHQESSPERRSVSRLAVLIPALLSLATVEVLAKPAPVPSVAAKAAYSSKTGLLTYSGKIKNLAPGTRVFLYDTDKGMLLHSRETDAKGGFRYAVPLESAPCRIRVEAENVRSVIAVGGASKACRVAPVCYIASPTADQAISAGQSVSFTGNALKGKAAAATTFSWNFGDGSTDTGVSPSPHVYGTPGSYRVSMTATTSAGGQCLDDRIVSVAPVAGTNSRAKVGEQPAPETAGAMWKLNGTTLTNDLNATVVLPFEETGMQGGSQISLPYNAMINYNSMNAQVLHKEAHKPKLDGGADIEVYFSAASNPFDPAGADSINSTSQNIFAGGAIGANIDTSVVNPTTGLPNANVFRANGDYIDAALRKTEQWDRIHQPTVGLINGLHADDTQWVKLTEVGTAFADRQYGVDKTNGMALPDEGVRGAIDKGLGVRSMPGKAAPYVANDPQKMDIGAYPADAVKGIEAFQPNTFVAQNIPITDIDDKGRVNPYPLLRIEARDTSAPDSPVVAKADAVYTTASETRCRECHLPGRIAANEDVWRTPVTELELENEDGTPGPATGAGSFSPGKGSFYTTNATTGAGRLTDAEAEKKPWPPAIHNRFNDQHPDIASAPIGNCTSPGEGFTNLDCTVKEDWVKNNGFDANGLRKDRVKASRWIYKDGTTTEVGATKPAFAPDGQTAVTDPTDWKLQIQLNFRDPAFYGDPNDWVAQEKAALFNTLVMHDYMVFYGPTPASGKDWPASYSTQVADSYADDVGKTRAQPMYFCSGHHTSQLKFDVGITGKSYPTNRSDYSRAFHAFHGKMQVYNENVAAADSADGQSHVKGELIRDERGHPKMFGGRGWDSQHDDDNGVPFTAWIPYANTANVSTILGNSEFAKDLAGWTASVPGPTWDGAVMISHELGAAKFDASTTATLSRALTALTIGKQYAVAFNVDYGAASGNATLTMQVGTSLNGAETTSYTPANEAASATVTGVHPKSGKYGFVFTATATQHYVTANVTTDAAGPLYIGYVRGGIPDPETITFNEKVYENLALATTPDSTSLEKPTVQGYKDPSKNNWEPELFPMHPKGRLMLPFGEHVSMEENCAKCHTGATEKSYRDVHHAAGLRCEDCHGDMLAVGNAYGKEGYNANLTGAGAYGKDTPNAIEPADFRRPWLDEPDCGSCHVGDGNLKKEGGVVNGMSYEHVFSEGVLKHAWEHGDKSGRSMDPMGARFAVMPTMESRPEKSGSSFVQNQLSTVLFRKSPDVHGSGSNGDLTCGTCHGGSHAIWPNPNPDANDNQTAKQLQGYAGNVVECSVCHIKDDFKEGLVGTDGIDPDHPTEPPLGVGQGYRRNSTSDLISPVAARAAQKKIFLAGPHGMHPVNDESWWKNAQNAGQNATEPLPGLNGGWHNDMATMPGPDGEDQCAACHGSDHKGTRLSRALTERDLVNAKGKAVHVAKDQVIGCDLCHTLKNSFIGAPNPRAKDGGWPKAKMHMPPMPMVPMPGGGMAGGSH